jgi:hypothetical protein
MVCNEFRNLMFERLGGELSPSQETACAEHEQSCVICRAELAQFKWVETRLRAGWPSEEPMPASVLLPHQSAQTASHNWFDLAAVWFARASAALVMACLVAVLLLRPSIEADRGSLHIAFGRDAARPQDQITVTQDQLRTMVQAEVNQEMARMQPVALATPANPATATSTSAKSADDAQRMTQVAFQVRQLQQSQASLWQQVQQHGIYLESLWHRSSGNVRPASFNQ